MITIIQEIINSFYLYVEFTFISSFIIPAFLIITSTFLENFINLFIYI
jgi:hypothetical protein